MGLTYSQVGLAAFISGSGATLSQPIFGYLSDRWGPRRLVAASILWSGLLMGLVGLVGGYGVLLVVVGLGALGSAAFHPAGAAAAGSISGSRRGASLSVFSVGGSIGSATSPLLITAAVAFAGLPGTLVLVPISLVAGALIYWQLRSDGPRVVKASGAYTMKGSATDQGGSLLALVLVVVMVMTRSWFQFSTVTYLPEWLQSQGWSAVHSSQMLTLLLVSVAVGALLGGVLSDRVGRWRILILTLGVLPPGLWLFLSLSGVVQVLALIVIGIMIGGSFPVSIAAAQEAWPRSIGVASGLVTGLGWLPGGVGASFTGFHGGPNFAHIGAVPAGHSAALGSGLRADLCESPTYAGPASLVAATGGMNRPDVWLFVICLDSRLRHRRLDMQRVVRLMAVVSLVLALFVTSCGIGLAQGGTATPPDAQKVTVGDIDVAYRVYGDGEPLVLIMGYGGSMDGWDPAAIQALAAKYKVIVFDNRGIGRTSAGTKDFSLVQFAEDTAGLIEALSIAPAARTGLFDGLHDRPGARAESPRSSEQADPLRDEPGRT